MDKPDDENQSVLALPLDRFDLSTRAANCIRVQELNTIGDLTRISAEEIMRWQNTGRKTLAEVRTLLGRIGLKLAGDQFPSGVPDTKLLTELRISAAKLMESVSATEPIVDHTKISLLCASPEKQRSLVIAAKELQLSVRARNVLHLAGASYLGEIAQLTQHSVMQIQNAGRTTARELAGVLSKHNLGFGMTIPDWSRSAVEDIRRRRHAEMSEVRQHEDRLLLASLGPEPQVLEDELLRIARALDNERNSGLIVSLWGWGGAPPRTLDSVGKELGVTRERVRQIESRALKRLATHKFETPLLKRALAALREDAPDLDAAIAAKIRGRGISRAEFSPWSIRAAAKHLGLTWSFEYVNIRQKAFLSADGEGDQLRRALSVIRKRTSERGCINLLALASEMQISEEKLQGLRRCFDATGQIQCLDDEREWLYSSGSPRNRLYNICSKVLGASGRLHLSELRRAVSKSRRLSMCPPQRVLGLFIQRHALGQLQEGVVIANPSVAASPAPDSAEGKMLSVLEKYGPVLEGEDFAEKCVAEGMNATTHYIYRLISPVICSLRRGIFCRVGAEVPPGTVEEIVARRRTVQPVSDHGWTTGGILWFGTQLSLQTITAGGIRLASFVADLIQGEWAVKLPDGTDFGTVTCRESFIWPFRKVFMLLGAEPGDLAAFQFDLKARVVSVRVGGPDLFEAIQQEENGSVGDDLESKEVETIAADTDHISYNDLAGDNKEWHPISIAPAEQELEVRLEDSFGRYVLLFPCKFLPGQGWINSRLETPLPAVPVDWRHWDKSSLRF